MVVVVVQPRPPRVLRANKARPAHAMNWQALQEELTVQEVILDSLHGETFEGVEAERDEARAEISRLKRALTALSKTPNHGACRIYPMLFAIENLKKKWMGADMKTCKAAQVLLHRCKRRGRARTLPEHHHQVSTCFVLGCTFSSLIVTTLIPPPPSLFVDFGLPSCTLHSPACLGQAAAFIIKEKNESRRRMKGNRVSFTFTVPSSLPFIYYIWALLLLPLPCIHTAWLACFHQVVISPCLLFGPGRSVILHPQGHSHPSLCLFHQTLLHAAVSFSV